MLAAGGENLVDAMRRREEAVIRRSVGVRDVPAAVAMLLVIALIYRRLIAGRVLAGGDLHIYFYPYWTAVVRAVQELRLPLWNSYLFAGAPLAANSQVGLFYPLNWPFWVFASPSLLGVARALHLSVLLHLGLASVSVYALARRTRTSPWAAALAGTIYAGGGFLGVHVEHLNQLQALAWLPLLFLPVRQSRFTLMGHVILLPSPLSVMAFAMILLAGHTQMAFIAAIGVVVWYGVCRLRCVPKRAALGCGDPKGMWYSVRRLRLVRVPAAEAPRWSRIVTSVWPWIVGLTPFALAGVIAAVQLLPTLQLTGLSGRSIGLDWRESISFSVRPWDLLNTLAPPYLVPPALPEGVAYVGITGLLLAALGTWRAVRAASQRGEDLTITWVILAGSGLLLALGAYNPLYLAAVRLHVPGFIHFRAPARFLALYALGISLVAGAGMDGVLQWLSASSSRRSTARRSTAVAVVSFVIVGFDLFLAGEYLPHAQATAARAYSDLRPATAYLVAAARAADAAGMAPERLLSISEMLFEVGDKAEIELVYGDTLSPGALWAYLVSSKQREILTPNLPLAFEVPAADGYDGGLLPLRHYIAFSELLIPGGTVDGRLRENLSAVPDARWLDLLGVRYLLTDKTGDVWIDDILYDRQFQPMLAEEGSLSVAWLPEGFPANAVGVLHRGGDVTVSVALADGRQLSMALPAAAAPDRTHWVRWPGSVPVVGLTFQSRGGPVQLTGVSLVDERSQAFYPLVLSNEFRLVHSGDVKIYETVNRPARLRLLADCEVAASAEEALARMGDPSFDPAETVVLEAFDAMQPVQCTPAEGEGRSITGTVSLVHYGGSDVTVDVQTDTPVHLMLTDAWYPGWEVWVEDRDAPGQKAAHLPLYRADLMFRAVPLKPGNWHVTFRYVPYILFCGLAVSLLGITATVAYAWWGDKKVAG